MRKQERNKSLRIVNEFHRIDGAMWILQEKLCDLSWDIQDVHQANIRLRQDLKRTKQLLWMHEAPAIDFKTLATLPSLVEVILKSVMCSSLLDVIMPCISDEEIDRIFED